MTTFEPDISLYGGPASGKSTQAQLLVKSLDLAHLSVGAELRKIALTKTPLGDKVRRYIEHGRLVPVSILMEIAENFVKKHKNKRILFDGGPRDVSQGRALEKLLKKYGRHFKMVYLYLPKTKAYKRLVKRGKQEGRIDDLDLQAVKNRFALFSQRSGPVLAHYKAQKNLIKVNADQTPAHILKEIITKLRDS